MLSMLLGAPRRNQSRSLCALGLLCCIISGAQGQNLTDDLLVLVGDRLATGATHSWEIGTRCQAIVNLNLSLYSIFPTSPSVPATLPPAGAPPSSITDSESSALKTLVNITSTVINNRPTSSPPGDAQPFFANDTAAGDPASVGFAALLANWTGAGSQSGVDYAGAARQQLNWLYNDVPRSSKGAFSHRQSELQLWADSVSMVPPFLAYYGLTTNNKTLLSEAYNQIKLYRDVLRDGNKSTSGIWFHIALGNVSTQDYGHWSTGNAWAAFGMSRVLGTIMASQFSNALKGPKNDLGKWIDEILDGMYRHVDSGSGLFWNYVTESGTFLDASSSALMAAAVYRNAMLRGQVHHIPDAERARKVLSQPGDGSSGSSSSSSSAASSSGSSDVSSSSSGSSSAAHSTGSSTPHSGSSHPSSSTSPVRSSTSTAPSPSTTTTSPSPTSSQSFIHFDDGWVQPIVDPLNWSLQGGPGVHSPEGQAFVLEMQSAYLAWVKAGSFGINAASSWRRAFIGSGLAWVVGLMSVWVLVLGNVW